MTILLNPIQQVAMDEEENALVIACPGSGKTRVLTLKIAKELERLKNRTDRIAALTFTNRAADEIDKRIYEAGIDVSKLWSGTIHSFCLQWIIKPYGLYLTELQGGFSVLDEFKAEYYKDEIKQELSIRDNFITRKNREGHYLNGKMNLNKAAGIYHSRLLRDKKIDFDLILYFSYVLIEKYPKISKNLSKIFKYFFIDEFQDTQELQYAIVGKIIKASEGECKIFLVGDPDQAIFKSLGGVVKSNTEIQEIIGGFKVKKLILDGNYRSTQRIINLYSNFQKTKFSIESMREGSGNDEIIYFDKDISKNKLAEKIAGIINEQLLAGVPENEICVLAPQWTFLTSIAKNLKLHLPDVAFDAPGLTILPSDRDNFCYKLARVILVSKSPDKYLIRMKWSKEILEELSLMTNTFIELDSDSCRSFLKLINSLKIDVEDALMYLEQAFKYIFEKMHFDYKSNAILVEQWESFFGGMKRRYERLDYITVPKDIHYMRNMFNSREGVVVNTCHGIKGEEFHTVIAFGLLRGYIPHWSQIINQPIANEIEESNKLLYVICSRAKNNLFLFSETGRMTNSRRFYEVNRQLGAIDFSEL